MPPEDNLTAAEMRELVDYDPFSADAAPTPPPEPDSAEPASEQETAPAADEGGAPPVSAEPTGAAVPSGAAEPKPPTSADPAAGAAAAPAGGTVEVGILQKLVESQLKQIETLTRQLQDTQAQTQAQAQNRRQASGSGVAVEPSHAAEAEGLPSYDFDIPDALVDGLSSDDPRERKLALRALVKGTATAVHQQMMSQIEPRFKSLPQEMESRVEARQRELAERERIRNDFYSTYPELNRPELAQFVGQVQQTVLAETGIKEWSPSLRDAIGNRARQILGMAVRAPAAAPPGAAQTIRPAVPAPPPAMQASNTRPPMTASSEVDQVWDLVMRP